MIDPAMLVLFLVVFVGGVVVGLGGGVYIGIAIMAKASGINVVNAAPRPTWTQTTSVSEKTDGETPTVTAQRKFAARIFSGLPAKDAKGDEWELV